MDIDKITMIVGLLAVIIALFVFIKRNKQKNQNFKKSDLLLYPAYAIFSFTSAISFVQMANLIYLTYTNKLTLEVIAQNKIYIVGAWGIMGIGALIAYITLLMDEKKENPNRSKHHTTKRNSKIKIYLGKK